MSGITAQEPVSVNTVSRTNWRRLLRGQEIGIFLVLFGMILFFTFATGGFGGKFLSSTNLSNILLNFSWTAIAAFGMTMGDHFGWH